MTPTYPSADLLPAAKLLASMWLFMQSVTSDGETLLRERHQLDLREVIVLSYLRTKPQQPTELARTLHLPRYEVSRLLTRLEGRGLIERQSGHAPDARRVSVHLTPAGEELWQASLQTANQVTARFLSQLTDQDLQHLTRTLAAINGPPQ